MAATLAAAMSPDAHKAVAIGGGAPMDSHAVAKRLQSELMALMAANEPGASAFPDGDSLFSWIGTIVGPSGTVYESLSYKLSLKFPQGLSYG